MTGPLILKDNPAEDLEAATKQYVDNHTSDVVLYTPQTLSDEQKVQARGNIGAAPDGFGLGEDIPSSAKNNDANTITKTGWFMASINTPTNGWWIIYSATYGDTMYQFAYANEGASSMLMGTVLQRSKKTANVDWTPWEYINPPMKLGVEYRTTERYLGKPVYAKLIDCGKFPAPGSVKQIAHGISDCYPIRVTGQMSNSNTVPWSEAYSIGADNTIIRFYAQPSFSDQSGTNTVALMHYTKTTD